MKATRKLIPALALLLVSAVLLSTASYAWFTTNTTVTATMSVGVTSPDNLQISKDGSSWGTTLALNTNVRLTPSSSVDGKNFFYIDDAALDDVITSGTGAKIVMDTQGNVTYADTTAPAGTVAPIPTTGTVKYVYTDNFKLLSANAIAAGKLSLSVAVTATKDQGAIGALRIAVFMDGQTFIFATSAEADTKAIKGTAATSEGTTTYTYELVAIEGITAYNTAKTLTGVELTGGTAEDVSIAVWYEGNDVDCVSQKVVLNNLLSIVLSFQNTATTGA